MKVEQKEIHVKLKEKVEELISAHQRLYEENKILVEQKASLENLLQKKEEAYIELERKYNQQQLAKAFVASNEEAHDAKIRVNRIVREIDQCIALLNR
ncbi:MAG: hypothetical protein ACLFNU_02820 [Bacteroidales bacterium]